MNLNRALIQRLELHGAVQSRNALAQQLPVEPAAFFKHEVASHSSVRITMIAEKLDAADAVRLPFIHRGC